MRSQVWRNFDYALFSVVLLLSIFSVAMIYSAVAGNESLASHAQRQALYVGIGIVVILIVTAVDYRYWMSLSTPLYVITVGFLIITFVAAKATFGAARWIETGIGFFIQPAELAKITVIITLAKFFSQHKDEPHGWRWIIMSLVFTAPILVFIYLQPNLSTTIVITVLWFATLWISGLPPKYIVFFIVGGLLLALIIFPFIEPYQQKRVFNFLVPDPNATHGDTYNVDQALITIGSGGWFGQGYQHGSQVQLHFLKVRHTDFIFAAMSEEFGFVGTVIVVALLLFVVFRCFRAAHLAPDMFGSLIAYGYGVLMLFQMSVNIGVNLNVIPVTGLTLPFISYGGSSMVSLLLGIGLVESVVARQKTVT